MDAKTLLERLFPGGHDVAFDGIYFSGTGALRRPDVAVIGTVDNAPIGVDLAYRWPARCWRWSASIPAGPS